MEENDAESTESFTIRSVDESREVTRDISSHILDLSALRGRVSEPGPGVSICEEDPERERLYIMRHTWTVRGLSREELAAGMDRLRRQLPEEGWEIIEEGELNNANRSPRILFESAEVEYAANVVLAGGTDEPNLEVMLVSGCFSTPEGESPRGQY